jgi:hypothetical protein
MSRTARCFILAIPVTLWFVGHLLNRNSDLFLRAQLLLRGIPFAHLVPANLDMANVDSNMSSYIIHDGRGRIGFIDGSLGVHLDHDTAQFPYTWVAVSMGSFFLQGGCVVSFPVAVVLALRRSPRRVGFPVTLSPAKAPADGPAPRIG